MAFPEELSCWGKDALLLLVKASWDSEPVEMVSGCKMLPLVLKSEDNEVVSDREVLPAWTSLLSKLIDTVQLVLHCWGSEPVEIESCGGTRYAVLES